MNLTLPPDLLAPIDSEVRKVTTVTPHRTVAAALLGITLVATAVTALLSGPADPKGEPATGAATIGLYLGLLAVIVTAAVFGVVAAVSEYRYQTISTTALFSADRDRLVAAKFLVTGGFALATAFAAEVFAVLSLLVFGRDKADFGLQLFAALGGGLLAAVCWSVIGVGLGLLLRSATQALWLIAVWLILIEPLLWLVADGMGMGGLLAMFPGTATISTVAVGSFPDSGFLAPTPAAIVVLLLWTAAIGCAGWWSLRTRDL
ncbi:ABC transporter permease [Nocardia callitridis]|uniref:ABC transporter permease n=1 Tax=Nocardia callitridis TaxID=648753 RepID=A0ABP9JRD6_9NOCA